MAWRDRLQSASFRGVPFEYRSDDLSGIGRRNQAHEYPKRDQGYVEDMGRSLESIDLEAILIGADYLERLDELLKALRAEGPGELVHPFYGRLQVVADSGCRVRHSFDEGGMCRISLTFREAGENKYPTAQEVPSLQVGRQADAVQSAAMIRFGEVFSVIGVPEWVRDDALRDIGSLVTATATVYRQARVGDWQALLGDAAGLASSLLELVVVDAGAVGLPLAKLFSARPRPVSLGVPSSAAQRQSLTNGNALLDLLTLGSIAQAARDIAAVEAPVYDDLLQWRSDFTAVVDREVERPGLPAASFDALADLRAGIGRYVLGESATASRLRIFTPPATLPAVVLAYDLYEDAARSDELVTRNGLRHPGFVPPDPLKVLSA